MTARPTSSQLSPRDLLIGAGGGLASVVMFYSAARGAMGLSLVMLPLVPLPTLIAGFGWGTATAIAAAVVSTTVLALLVAPVFALGYALALAIPAVGATYLLWLARYDADGALKDWFPVGRIMMAIALYGAALPVLMIAPSGGDFGILAPEFTRFFKQFSAQAAADSGWRAMDARQVQSLVDLWVELMPAIIASYWTVLFAVNSYLAGRVVRISGLLVRPWPNLHWLTYPPLLAGALALAIVGIVIGGSPRVLGTGAVGALAIAFLFEGLAVIHAFAAHRSASWLISAVYAALFVVGALAMPIIILLGVAETLMGVRNRMVGAPPALPPGSV